MNYRSLAEEALKLAEKATPGPWTIEDCDEDPVFIDDPKNDRGWLVEAHDVDNLELIAHAGTHYATLARRVIELEDAVAAEREACARIVERRSVIRQSIAEIAAAIRSRSTP